MELAELKVLKLLVELTVPLASVTVTTTVWVTLVLSGQVTFHWLPEPLKVSWDAATPSTYTRMLLVAIPAGEVTVKVRVLVNWNNAVPSGFRLLMEALPSAGLTGTSMKKFWLRSEERRVG